MLRKNVILAGFFAGLLMLGGAGALSPAQATMVGKLAVDSRAVTSKNANSSVTEVGWRERRRYRRKWRRHRGFERHRRYNRRHYRRYHRRRDNDVHIGLPLLGLGLFLGHALSDRHYERRYRGGGCSHWRSRCANNWGYGNNNYYGCLRYHGCR